MTIFDLALEVERLEAENAKIAVDLKSANAALQFFGTCYSAHVDLLMAFAKAASRIPRPIRRLIGLEVPLQAYRDIVSGKTDIGRNK